MRFFIFLFCLAITTYTSACTRIVYTPQANMTLVGNNMDWYDEMNTHLIMYPRGISHEGWVSGVNLKWQSRYASLVATAYDSFTTNGMNESGLAAHILGLNGSDYGIRDESQPGLLIVLWVQFYLDNFATVKDAIAYTESHPFQVVGFTLPNVGAVQLHLALEDTNGDSAVIEYLEGKAHIYHGSEYTILTNEPSFDQQLVNLKQYQGLGGDKPLPGSTYPRDRFVRASYYLSRLPQPNTTLDGVLQVFSLLENAGQPFGIHSPERAEDGHVYESQWRSVFDLNNHTLYFHFTKSLNTIWVRLNDFNLNAGAPIMQLNLNTNLIGNVSKYFAVKNEEQ